MNWIDKAINEQYRLIKVLKNTGQKQIFVYEHKQLGKRIVKRCISGTGDVYDTLKELSHPNIANVYEAVKGETGITVLEEYIDGQTVGEYLSDNFFTENGVRSVILSLCKALGFLHQHKIIHKDIKPENVMIDNSGTVKLIDFDAARIYKLYQSKDTKILGTTGYAAPEQYGLNQTDERTDIYALGVLMNVMLTGEPPQRKLYSGRLKNIIIKCTQTIPDKRYQSVSKLKKDL